MSVSDLNLVSYIKYKSMICNSNFFLTQSFIYPPLKMQILDIVFSLCRFVSSLKVIKLLFLLKCLLESNEIYFNISEKVC